MSYPGRCTKSPCPWSKPLLTCASTGDTQTLKGRSGSVSVGSPHPGAHKVLLEPSNRLWQVWDLIINVISALIPSCWGFSFALGRGVSFFSGIQHSPVEGCSAASRNFGVLAEDECTSFYSMWKENGGGLIRGSRHICWSGYLRFSWHSLLPRKSN